MTEEEEYYTSLLGITELLKYGTTCFLDPGSTKFLDACLEAYELSGCRLIVGWQVADRANPLNVPVSTTSDAITAMEKTIQDFHNRLDGRVQAWAMPFSPAYSSKELLVEAKSLADRYNTGLTLHFNNSRQYIEACVAQHGKRPAEYLEDIGVLGPNVLLAHSLGIDYPVRGRPGGSGRGPGNRCH